MRRLLSSLEKILLAFHFSSNLFSFCLTLVLYSWNVILGSGDLEVRKGRKRLWASRWLESEVEERTVIGDFMFVSDRQFLSLGTFTIIFRLGFDLVDNLGMLCIYNE